MAHRRGRTPRATQMARLLESRRRRGLTLAALSKETGIPKGTLAWWSHRLRAESKDRDRPSPKHQGARGGHRDECGFVELVSSPREVSAVAVEVELRCGRRLRLPLDLTPERVQDLVRAVESC